MISLVQNLKYDTNETIYKTEQIYRDREQICGCQQNEGWRRNGLGVGVSRCKLLCIEWINNKVLLYSTGNYIQYSVIYIYIYKLNHSVVQQKLTQHYKSTILQ